MTFDEWILHGVSAGYCTLVVCNTHDGVPVTDEEGEEFEEGYDPCIPVVRIWYQ